MKKSLIALAVLAAAAGTASAQSSVTLFGIVDATLQRGSVSGGNSRTQLGNSGYNSSRLGFRGVEDLGGGMSASFWLEAGVNNDNGTGAATNVNNQATGGALAGMNGSQGLTFNRRSTVSLSGGWGELRLGRDYSPQFWNLAAFDPFGYNGVGTQIVGFKGGFTGVTAVRVSNSFAYFLPPNIGGFYGQAQMWLGENVSNAAGGTADDGDGYGVRLGWASGPINVAVATSRTEYASGNVRTTNIGGHYDLGVAKIMAVWDRSKVGAITGKGWMLGASVPVGPGEIRASYGRYETDLIATGINRPEAKQIAVGYVHNLSKRTALYGTYSRVDNDGGSAIALNGATGIANRNATGWDLGIRHSF